MAAKVGTLLVLAVLAVVSGRKGKFTMMTNLEKLFYMEAEVISLASTFIREEDFAHEGEDHDHDLEDIQRMTTKGKELHRNISDVSKYLSHPINVLHLTRRLHRDWPAALSAVWNSEPCQKWDMPEIKRKVKNIEQNFPVEKDLEAVAVSIAKFQFTENIDLDDLFAGMISGHRSHEPVTLTDMIDMAWAAYNGGQFLFTTKVAERIMSECKKSNNQDGCDDPKMYKFTASSYFKINKLKEALEMINLVLKKDPDDKGAQRSRKFYEGRLKSGRKKGPGNIIDIPNIKYYETCRGDRNMTAAQMSRLHCKLVPTKEYLMFDKVEIHHIDPPILEIHSSFKQEQLDEIQYEGEIVYQKQAMGDKYETPNYTYKPDRTNIYSVFSKRFLNMKGPLIWPLDIGTVEVRQTGMEGMYFRPKDRELLPSLGNHIGSFFTTLNSNYTGGEFVFPKYKLKFRPQMGATLFFFATKSTLNICPVSYGVQWVAVQSLFEMEIKNACRKHDEDLSE